MNKDEVKEKLKSGLDKVVESSKVAFSKAGNAVQKFSDSSVLHIEIKQYESKRKAELLKLGTLALEKFQDDTAVLSASEEAVVAIKNSISEIDGEIEKRKKLLPKNEKESSGETPSD